MIPLPPRQAHCLLERHQPRELHQQAPGFNALLLMEPPSTVHVAHSTRSNAASTEQAAVVSFRVSSHQCNAYISIVGSKEAYTLDDCINLCDQTSGCIDVSYARGNPGACYLKNAQNQPNYNNVWGARRTRACTPKMVIRDEEDDSSSSETEDEDVEQKRTVHHRRMAGLFVRAEETDNFYADDDSSSSDEDSETKRMTKARLHRKRIAGMLARDGDTNNSSDDEDDKKAKRMEKLHKRFARMFKRNKDKNTDSDSSSDEEGNKGKKYGGPDQTYGNPSTVKATKGTTSYT